LKYYLYPYLSSIYYIGQNYKKYPWIICVVFFCCTLFTTRAKERRSRGRKWRRFHDCAK